MKVTTLSNGRFQEFFTNDSLRRIGSVVYDTRLHRVAYLLPPDSLMGHAKAEITSRWMSPAPLAEKFMYESPYVFVSNNPVNKFDSDGRSGIAAIDTKSHTVTISSTMYYYESTATTDFARNSAATIQSMWNGANGTVNIGSEKYSVRFEIKGVAVHDDIMLQDIAIPMNNSLENNFIRVDGETDHGTPPASFTEALGANSGHWGTNQNKETGGTTGPHEYGHGLGLGHTDTKGFTEKRRPDIVMTESYQNVVPAQYVTHKDGNGAKLDVTKRKVTQDNINLIFTPQIVQNLQKNGGIGNLTNRYYASPSK